MVERPERDRGQPAPASGQRGGEAPAAVCPRARQLGGGGRAGELDQAPGEAQRQQTAVRGPPARAPAGAGGEPEHDRLGSGRRRMAAQMVRQAGPGAVAGPGQDELHGDLAGRGDVERADEREGDADPAGVVVGRRAPARDRLLEQQGEGDDQRGDDDQLGDRERTAAVTAVAQHGDDQRGEDIEGQPQTPAGARGRR